MKVAGVGAGETEQSVVYVVQQASHEVDDDLNLAGLFKAVWRHRWWVIGLTSLVTALAVAYALLAQPVYQAEAVLYPRESRAGSGLTSQLSQLGGLADIAGIGTGANSKQEPLGVLRSKGFAGRFIAQKKLASVIAPDAPASEGVRKAVEIFGQSVLSVFEDKRTGLVTVGVKWKDAEVAADWANAIVRQLNDEMRARALRESDGNIKYLTEQLASTSTVSLQESISRLIEAEMQKVMLARGTDDYSFRVVDAAEPPVRRAWPKRSLIVIMAFSLGLLASVLMAALSGPVRRLMAGARAA